MEIFIWSTIVATLYLGIITPVLGCIFGTVWWDDDYIDFFVQGIIINVILVGFIGFFWALSKLLLLLDF
tara:strand:- start:9234 stop:9440 length:207 start_codon:yes stop_codon:yes gene_type:complete